MIEPIYPPPDPERESRIVKDVISLMKLQNDKASTDRVARWLFLTLIKAQVYTRLPWWFARRLFACMVYPGQDVFDLQGELDKIISAFCPVKLNIRPMDYIINQRSSAHTHQRNDCGEPCYYAIHGGRLHLWPAPDEPMMLCVTYSLHLTPDIVPQEWESYLLDGVIGLYGRHFDSSGLLEKADEFVSRFYAGLKASRSEHYDSEAWERIDRANPTTRGMSASHAYGEVSSAPIDDQSFENAILKPAYNNAPGEIQILANKGSAQQNTRGTPITQIKGTHQP